MPAKRAGQHLGRPDEEGSDLSREDARSVGGGARAPGKRFIDDVNVHRRHKTVQRLIFESHVPLLARTLLRSQTLTFYFDNLFVKEPGAGPTPWHQDASYQRANGQQNVNF